MPAHPEQEAHLFLAALIDLCTMLAKVKNDESLDEDTKAEERDREMSRFLTLGGSYSAHLYSFAFVDHDQDLTENVEDILERLMEMDLEFLTLYFEIFAEIIHGVVAVDNGPKSGAGPPTADSVRKHVERALVAKRMWEFREALKAIILDKRLEAAEDTAQKAEEEAEMLAKRTADLEVAHKEFRALKNSTRDSLREAIRIADNQTEETKQATKDLEAVMDSRLGEHDKHLDMLGYSTDSVDLLIEAQQTMLSYRLCGMCLVDRRMVRRQCYICIGFFIIVMTAYGMYQALL